MGLTAAALDKPPRCHSLSEPWGWPLGPLFYLSFPACAAGRRQPLSDRRQRRAHTERPADASCRGPESCCRGLARSVGGRSLLQPSVNVSVGEQAFTFIGEEIDSVFWKSS